MSAGQKTGKSPERPGGGEQVTALPNWCERSQVDFTAPFEACGPACRHVGDLLGSAGQLPCESVLESAVNDALTRKRLTAAERGGGEQDRPIAAIAQTAQEPESGDAAAHDHGVEISRGCGRITHAEEPMRSRAVAPC